MLLLFRSRKLTDFVSLRFDLDATIREQAASIAIKKGDFAAAERQLAALVAFEPDRAQHAKRLEALKQLRQRGTN